MIPHVIHFIYLKNENTHRFHLMHYISIKSNIIINNPEVVKIWSNDFTYLHSNKEYLKLLEEFPQLIEEVQTDLINEHRGHPVYFLSHQADILKNRIMLTEGGIYSDLDSIAVRAIPGDWYRSDKPILCAEEDPNGNDVGLCYGFFMSPKKAEFIRLIDEEYNDYDFPEDKKLWKYNWGEFAIDRPLRIYKENPDLIKKLPAVAFEPFYTDYTSRYKLLHINSPIPHESYQVHLWENILWEAWKFLDQTYALDCDTTLSNLMEKYI